MADLCPMPGFMNDCKWQNIGRTALSWNSVILSGGRSPESKDLRTHRMLGRWSMRGSFDSPCSLRMTTGREKRTPGAFASGVYISIYRVSDITCRQADITVSEAHRYPISCRSRSWGSWLRNWRPMIRQISRFLIISRISAKVTHLAAMVSPSRSTMSSRGVAFFRQ